MRPDGRVFVLAARRNAAAAEGALPSLGMREAIATAAKADVAKGVTGAVPFGPAQAASAAGIAKAAANAAVLTVNSITGSRERSRQTTHGSGALRTCPH